MITSGIYTKEVMSILNNNFTTRNKQSIFQSAKVIDAPTSSLVKLIVDLLA